MAYIMFGLVLIAMFGAGCGFAYLLNKTDNVIVIQLVSLVSRGLMLAPLMFVLIAIFVLAGVITPQMLAAQDKSAYIVIAVGFITAIIAIAIEEKTFAYLCHHHFVGNMVSAAIPAI
jgi:hypothetical protein